MTLMQLIKPGLRIQKPKGSLLCIWALQRSPLPLCCLNLECMVCCQLFSNIFCSDSIFAMSAGHNFYVNHVFLVFVYPTVVLGFVWEPKKKQWYHWATSVRQVAKICTAMLNQVVRYLDQAHSPLAVVLSYLDAGFEP